MFASVNTVIEYHRARYAYSHHTHHLTNCHLITTVIQALCCALAQSGSLHVLPSLHFLFLYSLEHFVKRLVNISSANRSTRCIPPSVLTTVHQAFTVSSPILNFRGQNNTLKLIFSSGPSDGSLVQKRGSFTEF